MFAINTYSLDVTLVGSGDAGRGLPDAASYEHGTTVILAPSAAVGWNFSGWSGADVDDLTDNGDGSWSIVMDAAKSLTATFAINTFSLTYTAGPNGSLTGDASQTVNYGEDGTAVTAVPDTGYHFVDWSDGALTATRTDTNVMRTCQSQPTSPSTPSP